MILSLTIVTILSIIYPIIALCKIKEVPESLSETYYKLNKGWVFQIIIFIIGILLLPIWLNITDNFEFLPFLSCASLLFISTAPSFKLKLEGVVHYTAAIICCTSAVLWQIFEGLWDTLLFFSFIGWMLYLQYKKWCFWLELAIIYSIIFNIWRII